MKRIIPIILLLVHCTLYKSIAALWCVPLDTLPKKISLQTTSWLKPLEIQNRTFKTIFGGNSLELIPRGTIGFNLLGQYNSSNNPFFSTKKSQQWGIDFNQHTNLTLKGKIGERATFEGNLNTEAQFDFENQFRFNYIGREEDIIQRIEVGNVNMKLGTSLIQGSESLFGVKTQLQYGKFTFTGIAAQKKTSAKEIIINNGAQQGEFELNMTEYDANKHYFLAQYFRDNYNQFHNTATIINSPVNITHVELWLSNRTIGYTDTRDIIAFMDIGESKPYNTIISRISTSSLPSSGTAAQQYTDATNNLLALVGDNSRIDISSNVQNLFATSGGKDNYAIVKNAKRLIENQDYTINRKLGYISLYVPLNQDQILAASYRYSVRGKEYQVGQLSYDHPIIQGSSSLLYTKLLKNDALKTTLPIWDLMMKNIYRLQASNISEENFQVELVHKNQTTGIESPIVLEGQNTQGKTWLELLHLDRITQNNAFIPDGIFDWLPTITIDQKAGLLLFPSIEPFGKDLESKFSATEDKLATNYIFPELYQLTKDDAVQQYASKNRFKIRGKYNAERINEFYLGTINLEPGAVSVYSGGLLLYEGTDYSIDYAIGVLRIINPIILISGIQLVVTIENEASYGSLQKTLMGARLDYQVNPTLSLGTTIMNLRERPQNQHIILGNEPISNTLYGFDINYSRSSSWLSKLVNKIPFIHSTVPSYISLYGEFAKSITQHASSKDNNTSYIDDFESSFAYMSILAQSGWQIASTPLHFKESTLSNDIAYGYNRSLIALYSIDPVFYQPSNRNLNINNSYLTNHRTRRISETEVFPFREVRKGTDPIISTLDLAFYPMLRGPYNYSTTNLLANGRFNNPQQKWGGMFKKIEQIDFEAQNIEYLEMWLMDPVLTNPNKAGGDIYINLGNISEDILKDGLQSIENGLSPIGDPSVVEETVWGKVAKTQPIIQSFENTDQSRSFQDIGLDGLTNDQERLFHRNFLNRSQAILSAESFDELLLDPSTDDYIYFRGKHVNFSSSLLDRYKYINGTQGNSRTRTQSMDDFGVENSARTLLPDGEDINNDYNMNERNEYYQYKLSTRPEDMVIGKNHIVDEQISTVQIDNRNIPVKWYKIRISLTDYQNKEGQIDNFKNIRFIRIYMTNYDDTAVFRFAKMQFVKGEWRKYNTENDTDKVITDPSLGRMPSDNSTFSIANINIEENGKRSPIPYVMPPGVNRQLIYSNNNVAIKQNEQALSLQVFNLKDGYGRAVYKTVNHDFRSFGRLEMYVHAEGQLLSDGHVTTFLRMGTDDRFHYYEYEHPLQVTSFGTNSPELIWPEQNSINIQLQHLLDARIARDNSNQNGLPWPHDIPFEYYIDKHKITVLGIPDLSQVRFIMLGIRNPLKNSALSPIMDNGNPISGEFWFNELRLTDYNDKGGWSAVAQLQLKLADIANVAITVRKSTAGFGTLSQRLGERNKADHLNYDISTNAELGKLFNPNYRISIPFYFSYSKQIITPEYNPFQPDIKLNQAIRKLSTKKRDSLLQIVQDYTHRKSFSFYNVRRMRIVDTHIIKPWDIENIGLTFSFSEMRQRDFNTQLNLRRTYNAVFDYSYSNPSVNYKKPFKNIGIKKLGILKQFSYNLIPTLLTFRLDVNRIYSENTFRNNSNENTLPTYYNRNLNMSRIYGISWDLTQALRLDFNATNYSIIDDPNQRINGAKVDTLWNNFLSLGRTTDYNHMLNITYDLPIHRLPYLDWIKVYTRYGTQFNWQNEPFNTWNMDNINLGNSIQNNRTIQINPTLNFNTFYRKFRFIRNNSGRNNKGMKPFFVQLLTTIRQVNAAYTKMQGSYLPGYLPNTNLLGLDFNSNAPGLGFIFGSQRNILYSAINNNWLSTEALQSQQFVNTYAENISGIINIEPIRNLRIDITFSRIHNFNSAMEVYFDDTNNLFNIGVARITGNYTISQMALGASFRSNTTLFQEFNNRKKEISTALAENNINSVGISNDFFADGYDRNQQDVIINAFMNTYIREKTPTLNRKPTIPLPNWRLNYNGMIRLLGLEDYMQAINIAHSFQSQYTIGGYNSNNAYMVENGMVYTRDLNGNFSVKELYSTISSIDRFFPLIGIDIRFKNSLSISSEYRKLRSSNLNITNSQLAIQEEQSIILGLHYRKNNTTFPFRWFQDKKWKNDVSFKFDIALNDRKTTVLRSESLLPEIAAGNKSVTVNPSLDYTINRYYSIRLFYNSNFVQPYTSQSFGVGYTDFGINLRLQFH